MALLSIHYRRLNESDPSPTYEDEMIKVWNDNRKLKNVGLRYEVQVELAPELLELFEVFHKADRQLNSTDQLDILTQDYEDTLREECDQKSAFLKIKRSALERLLQHFHRTEAAPSRALPWEVASEDSDWHAMTDEFGYNGKGVETEVYNAIRDHQARNMARSYLIKSDLGYSVLALKSSIPEAGRGVYVDGTAPPGAIIGFFPGQVWPREYLLDPIPALVQHLSWERNPNFQLHFRGDDVLLDCRASPYTVLENPWAIGHIANHAPISQSNSRVLGVNFFEKMRVPPSLWHYVPNEYAKPPTLMGGSFLDRDVVEMHSMCLLNKRKALSNEEVLFDYRLQIVTNELPEWYTHVDYELESGIDEQE